MKVPDDLDARLRHEAERRGTTVSEITRAALEAYLTPPRRRLGFTAIGRSGEHDISVRVEQILRQEWGGRGSR